MIIVPQAVDEDLAPRPCNIGCGRLLYERADQDGLFSLSSCNVRTQIRV